MTPQEASSPDPRRRFVTLSVVALALAGMAVAAFLFFHRSAETGQSMLARMPTDDAIVLSVDVQALRQGGLLRLLAANQMAEEGEYKSFVQNSGFDYQSDLDSVLMSFAPSGTYIVAKGRFEWSKLQQYAIANHGSCYNKLCRMQGSTPERRISFLPLRQDVIGLAISTDDLAASKLEKRERQQPVSIPAQPMWLSFPGSTLQKAGALSSGTRVFAQALKGADRVQFTLGPHGKDNYEAHLEAICPNEADAKVVSGQLTKLTALLKTLMARSKQDDIPALLASGSFSQSGVKVFGYWPISKHLLQTLGSGS